MITYKDLNKVVKCINCGKIDWGDIEPPEYEGGSVSAKCNNCEEWLLVNEPDLEYYAQLYDEKMEFVEKCPCPECGDISWISEEINWPEKKMKR